MTTLALQQPIAFKTWRFESDRLVADDGRAYPYESIVHLGFIGKMAKRSFVPIRFEATIYIAFADGTALTIGTDDCLPTDSDDIQEPFTHLWKSLSEATLPQRVKPYVTQLQTQGYFDFDGNGESAPTRFYQDGRVVQGELEADLKINRYSMGNDFFRVHIPGWTRIFILDELSSRGDIVVSTVVDGDALYVLIPLILAS